MDTTSPGYLLALDLNECTSEDIYDLVKGVSSRLIEFESIVCAGFYKPSNCWRVYVVVYQRSCVTGLKAAIKAVQNRLGLVEQELPLHTPDDLTFLSTPMFNFSAWSKNTFIQTIYSTSFTLYSEGILRHHLLRHMMTTLLWQSFRSILGHNPECYPYVRL